MLPPSLLASLPPSVRPCPICTHRRSRKTMKKHARTQQQLGRIRRTQPPSLNKSRRSKKAKYPFDRGGAYSKRTAYGNEQYEYNIDLHDQGWV